MSLLNRIMSFLIVCLVFLLSGCATSSHASDRASDIAKIREAKLKTWPAIYDNMDADWLSRFLNDDHVFIDDTGRVETKEDILQWMRKAPPPTDKGGEPDDFIYTIKDIVFYGPDVAMVYGHGDSIAKRKLANHAHIIIGHLIYCGAWEQNGAHHFPMCLG